ncbi:MAG TPA: CHAT domain-containing protein, partial [Thermomicrobiales bacterium]|nr:CHAT domain-containing protein [Thermomicrobiales bacterium]
HRLYASGIDAYLTQEFAVARPRFEQAAHLFSEARSPMALWARYFVAVCDYGQSRIGEAANLLLELGVTPDYPYLETRRLWMLNLTSGTEGHYSAAVEWGEKALDLIEKLDDPSGRASMRLNLAGALVRLSRDEEAWGYRVFAVRESARLGGHRLRHNALSEVVTALTELGREELALPFLQSALENAREWDNPIAVLEIERLQAAVLVALGRRDEAIVLLEHCEQLAADHRDEKLVKRLKADIAVERAAMLANDDSGQAMGLLSSAAESYRQLDLRVPAIRLHRLRSRAAAESGHPGAAEEALLEAIEIHRALLRDQNTTEDRRGYLGETRRAYEDLIYLRAAVTNQPDGAFQTAEEYRLAFLDQAAPNVVPIGELQDRLAPGAAIVSYELLDDRVLAWVITRRDMNMFTLRVSRQELQRLVAVHQIEIRQLRQAPADGAATSLLYELLWRPLTAALQGHRSLMIVTDPEVGWVGFSGLWDRHSQEHLAAKVDEIVLFPVASLAGSGQRDIDTSRLLVIGDPAFDRPSFPTLARLPDARSEAEAIAESLPNATLLVAEQATAGRILAELRNHSVLHFAGHHLPGPEGGSLLVASSAAAEGLMTWSDLEPSGVQELDLVVLSTCSAGRTESWRQRRMGLAERLLVAGAGAVVASPFEVEDRHGSRILFQFYRALSEGVPAAAALHAAKRAALDQPTALWVPFDLYGTFTREQRAPSYTR